MTPLQLVVWVLLMAMPRHSADAHETYAERAGRMALASFAIVDAADGHPLRCARLLALGRSESGFAAYIGEGRCKDGPRGSRCDLDARGRPQSRGYWQPQRRACPAAWAAPAGSVEGTRAAARCADRLMRAGLSRCSTYIEGPDKEPGAFAGYNGGDCGWSGARRRARLSHAYHAKILTLLSNGQTGG